VTEPVRPPVTHRLVGNDTSLLPKLLGAFLVVLTISSALTLVIENGLTRSRLSQQAEDTLLVDRQDAIQGHSNARVVLSTLAKKSAEALAAEDPGVWTRELTAIQDANVEVSFAATIGPDGQSGGAPLPVPDERVLRRATERPPVFAIHALPGSRRTWVEAVVWPIRSDHYLILGSRIDEAWMTRRFASPGGAIYVVVEDGELVASSQRIDIDVPDPRGAAEPETGIIATEGSLAAFEPLDPPVDGWGVQAHHGVVVTEPLADLDASLTRNRVVMIALLIAVAGTLAWAMTRVLTRPLTSLTRTARRIASGDMTARFEVESRDEIGMLAAALERMRTAIGAQVQVIRRQSEELQDAALRIVRAQDDERRRLARDLHDGIQQQLVMLRVKAGMARTLSAHDPERGEQLADEVTQEIDRILDRLRETSQDIFPSILQDRGLSGGLNSLAGRSTVAIATETVPDPLPRFDRLVESNAYFLVAEAVTNAIKHASASRLRVFAQASGGRLLLRVTDDGVGFDPSDVRRRGLDHMRDRAQAVGGSFRVDSRTGQGTTVEAVFPVSVAGALEVEQDGGDPAVEVELLGQAELPEDGVGVLLDRPLGDDELAGDGGVALPGRHRGEHLELPGREPG
jgi:signal transduction histidine kinase